MTGLTDAVKYCCDRIDSNQTLFISDSLAAPYGRFFKKDLKPLVYVYSLFYGKIDPWSYQHGGFSNTFVQDLLYGANRPALPTAQVQLQAFLGRDERGDHSEQ
jgi:hypothetical protein